MAVVDNVRVYRTLDESGKDAAVISWDLIVPDVPDVTGFNVYRAYLSTYEEIASNVSQNFYLDESVPRTPGQNWYYKVTYISTASGESSYEEATRVNLYTDAPDGMRGRLYYALSETVRRVNFGLSTVGEDIKIFIRRRIGDTCPVCYDMYAGDGTLPDCTTCYGTGIEGGYDIYSGRGIFHPASQRVPMIPQGIRVDYLPRGVIANYPIIHDGDGVKRQDGRAYLLSEVSPVIMQNFLIEQEFTITAVPEGHVFHLLG